VEHLPSKGKFLSSIAVPQKKKKERKNSIIGFHTITALIDPCFLYSSVFIYETKTIELNEIPA
jgi:hypothetical protein